MPERMGVDAGILIGVEAIEAVMLGCNENHIVRVLAWDRDSVHVERLSIYLAIHRLREELPERVNVQSCGRQLRLFWILPCARVVVVLRQDVGGRNHGRREATLQE